MQLCAKHIYITAPSDPRTVWSSRTSEDIAQLERRIDEVKYFGPEAEAVIADFEPAN